MPRARIKIMANSVTGKAAHTATAPLTSLSSQLPRHHPPNNPNAVPKSTRAAVPAKAKAKVCLAPASTNACMSRPIMSLPHGKTDEGTKGEAFNCPSIIIVPCTSPGLALVNCSPKKATPKNANTSAVPITSVGLPNVARSRKRRDEAAEAGNASLAARPLLKS
jgi:hypothetical protein